METEIQLDESEGYRPDVAVRQREWIPDLTGYAVRVTAVEAAPESLAEIPG